LDLEKAKETLGGSFSFTAGDINRVVQGLSLNKKAKILDAGTGVSNMAIVLALNGYSVITGEPQSDESEYAKQDWFNNSKKVGVQHLIEFKHFDAQDTKFESSTFGAIFFLGTFHHIDKDLRVEVFQESIRISKPNAVICFFEPNQKCMEIILPNHPNHPEVADPREYSQGLDLSFQHKPGDFFDAYIFHKNSAA